jgi:methyl-accepting chemotaxis protein
MNYEMEYSKLKKENEELKAVLSEISSIVDENVESSKAVLHDLSDMSQLAYVITTEIGKIIEEMDNLNLLSNSLTP